MTAIRFPLALLPMALAASLAAAGPDLESLDRVHVLMPRARVLELLGPPHEQGTLKGGLQAEVYRFPEEEPLVGIACVYSPEGLLTSQALHFRGDLVVPCRTHLIACGFLVLEERSGAVRLQGRDDDTGRPLVATIAHEAGITTVMTFEKDFYDRTILP